MKLDKYKTGPLTYTLMDTTAAKGLTLLKRRVEYKAAQDQRRMGILRATKAS